MQKLVLVDGNALLHRAYHATPPLTTSKGELVNAVFGFTTMIFKALEELKPDYIAIAWDEAAPTFRHQAYTQYKATRGPADEGLTGQYEKVFAVSKALNIPEFRIAGYEADDLIGTLAKQAEKTKDLEVVIVTGDRDIMQLIDNKIKILMPRKTLQDVGLYGVEEFCARYGFMPLQLRDFKALAGDSSDNIPGVPGIGEVTATKLIHQFGTIEEIYKPKNLSSLPERQQTLLAEGAESAVMSKQLATLDLKAPIKLNLKSCQAHDFDKHKAIEVFKELEFKSLVNKLLDHPEQAADSRESEEPSTQTDQKKEIIELDKNVEVVLKKMSEAGVLIDAEFLDKLGKTLKRQLKSLEEEIYSKVGHQFNLNSPKQLSEILFDELKLPVVRKTKTGRSTDEATLHELSIIHPMVPLLLEYRQLFKLVSTYIDALPKYIKEDGRIHSTFNVEGAATGRLSCVPLNSKILTKNGWKSYKELKIGELVIGYNIIQNKYCWTELKHIHRGRDYVGLLKINSGHDAAFRRGIWCTGEHRWIVKNNKVIGFSKAKELPRVYDTLLLPKSVFPDTANPLLTKQGAFLLGWYLTDGFLTGRKNVGLGINVVKKRSVKMLEKYLKNTEYSKSKYRYNNDKSHYVTAYHISSKIFNSIYQIYKTTSPSNLILNLSKTEREFMLMAMLEGDGSMRRKKKKYDRFGALKEQKKATCEIFELLCVSLGKPFKSREYKLPKSDNVFVEYYLLDGELTANKNSNWKKEKIEDVWCPETSCGTWVMRQGNQIIITGNSQNPNLQNIPIKGQSGSEVRKAFMAPKGKILLGADYSQIELRIVAHLADDPGLKKAFEEDLDIHATTAAKIFKVPLEKVTKEQRMIGKTMNFATLYGQGPRALSQQLKVDYAAARLYIDEYFEQFPKVRKWMEETLEQGYEKGYVETILGRRRYIPELKAGNRMIRSAGERAAVNHPVQGTAADMIKKAMVEVDKELTASSCKLILQIHDELLFECDPGQLQEVAKMVQNKMENALQLSIPVKVELKSGNSWGEMKSYD